MRTTNSSCLGCGKGVYRRPRDIIEGKLRQAFCSEECKQEKNASQMAKDRRYHEYIRRWKAGEVNGMRGQISIAAPIRRYLFEKYQENCSRCGWGERNSFTGRIPLEVEHKDGNHRNNKEENLDLLCPNCHSLTGTYRSLNYGKGRPGRSSR